MMAAKKNHPRLYLQLTEHLVVAVAAAVALAAVGDDGDGVALLDAWTSLTPAGSRGPPTGKCRAGSTARAEI